MAAELHRLKLLAELHTGFAIPADGWLDFAYSDVPAPVRRWLANRRMAEVPCELVHLQPVKEGLAVAGLNCGLDEQRVLHWRNAAFQRAVPTAALARADVVIGFDTSSWILARRCQELGRPFIMVQTIGHPDAMAEVAADCTAQFPKWDAVWHPRRPEVRAAEQKEHDSATLIVGSSGFTRRTLVAHGVPEGKIHVLPHGVDCRRFTPGEPRGARPFRFVFVGAFSGRKGAPLLLEAWRRLQPTGAELWLVGPVPSAVRRRLAAVPGLRVWGEVPNTEVPDLLRQCDTMVFPSYFEGFGLVILQAMACGLPVITTTATAGPDLIPAPGEGGWVIPVGDGERLQQTMEHCLAHQDDMPGVGRCARAIAERHSWQAYGRNWVPILEAARTRRPVREASHPAQGSCRRPGGVLLTHPGTQYAYQLARELHRLGRLGEFHTSFALPEDGWAARSLGLLPAKLRRRLANRRLTDVPAAKVKLYLGGELTSQIGLRQHGHPEAVMHRRNEQFQLAIPERTIRSASAVIAFDTSAWLLADRCRTVGVPLVLDQSIGHPDSKLGIYERVRRDFPEWGAGIEPRLPEVRAAEQQEHDAAALVVAASTFTVRTLAENGVSREKIALNPYGVDVSRFQLKAGGGGHALRFVFVGSVTARKGVPLLLQAWERLRPRRAELWLVGPVAEPLRRLIPDRPDIRVIGPVPHGDVPGLLQECDMFVFPSYFEGFGLVIPEALACGLPVITTTATAGPDLDPAGEASWIIEPGDGEALGRRMEECLMNPAAVQAKRTAARQIAERCSWAAYGERWAGILDSLPR